MGLVGLQEADLVGPQRGAGVLGPQGAEAVQTPGGGGGQDVGRRAQALQHGLQPQALLLGVRREPHAGAADAAVEAALRHLRLLEEHRADATASGDRRVLAALDLRVVQIREDLGADLRVRPGGADPPLRAHEVHHGQDAVALDHLLDRAPLLALRTVLRGHVEEALGADLAPHLDRQAGHAAVVRGVDLRRRDTLVLDRDVLRPRARGREVHRRRLDQPAGATLGLHAHLDHDAGRHTLHDHGRAAGEVHRDAVRELLLHGLAEEAEALPGGTGEVANVLAALTLPAPALTRAALLRLEGLVGALVVLTLLVRQSSFSLVQSKRVQLQNAATALPHIYYTNIVKKIPQFTGFLLKICCH